MSDHLPHHATDDADPSGVGGRVREWYDATTPDESARRRALQTIQSALDRAAHPAAHDSIDLENPSGVSSLQGRSRPGAPGEVDPLRGGSARWRGRRGIAVLWATGALAATLFLALRRGPDGDAPGAPRSSADATVERRSDGAAGTQHVDFALRLADASVHQVTLAGDFNGWDPSAQPMHRDPADGTWRAHLALAPGRHVYSFVVNGTRWVIDPLAPRTQDLALGPANVIAVSGDL